jgi:hypothetical protein
MLEKEPATLGMLGLDHETHQKLYDRLKASGFDGGICFWPTKFKDRFECIVNTLAYLLSNSDGGKKLDVEEKLWHEMKMLAQSLVYLTNSASYRKGSYFDFDKLEINKKLGRHKRI